MAPTAYDRSSEAIGEEVIALVQASQLQNVAATRHPEQRCDHAMDALRYLVVSGIDVAKVNVSEAAAAYRRLRGHDD